MGWGWGGGGWGCRPDIERNDATNTFSPAYSEIEIAFQNVLKKLSFGYENGVDIPDWEWDLWGIASGDESAEKSCKVASELLATIKEARDICKRSLTAAPGATIKEKLYSLSEELLRADPSFKTELAAVDDMEANADELTRVSVAACFPVNGGEYVPVETCLRKLRAIQAGHMKDFITADLELDLKTLINGLNPLSKKNGALDTRLLAGSSFVKNCARQAVNFLKVTIDTDDGRLVETWGEPALKHLVDTWGYPMSFII